MLLKVLQFRTTTDQCIRVFPAGCRRLPMSVTLRRHFDMEQMFHFLKPETEIQRDKMNDKTLINSGHTFYAHSLSKFSSYFNAHRLYRKNFKAYNKIPVCLDTIDRVRSKTLGHKKYYLQKFSLIWLLFCNSRS